MTAAEIVNFYIQYPPFDIQDQAKYVAFLQFQIDTTLLELSENDPILSETTFTSAAAIGDESHVLFDSVDIHSGFMEFVLLHKASELAGSLSTVLQGTLNQVGYYVNNTVPSISTFNAAINSGSVVDLLAINEFVPIIHEWYLPRVKKMIFDGHFIKVLPLTEYYVLFYRYKTMNELQRTEMLTFQKLFGINLMLAIYQTDLFANEAGVRSVSMSGLSVSFNVPDIGPKVKQLQDDKDDLLGRMALDYGDGTLGLI